MSLYDVGWGINEKLQADIRYEPNACKGYVFDISLGCPHHCRYCLFSQVELRAYKLMQPEYKGDVLPLKLNSFLKRDSFPPAVYMCYSSDPLGNAELRSNTIRALQHLFQHDVNVLFITKGLIDDEFLMLVSERPDLMNIQIDIASSSQERNRIFEPCAPSYEERLENLKKLMQVDGIASLGIRMDPLLPDVDDDEENLRQIFHNMSAIGVTDYIAGYVLLTPNMKKSWAREGLPSKVSRALSEITPTISGQKLYSLPFDEKVRRLTAIEKLGSQYGMNMSVCGCKDHRLKDTEFEWICHPYNREKREQFVKQTGNDDFVVEFDHLGRAT